MGNKEINVLAEAGLLCVWAEPTTYILYYLILADTEILAVTNIYKHFHSEDHNLIQENIFCLLAQHNIWLFTVIYYFIYQFNFINKI